MIIYLSSGIFFVLSMIGIITLLGCKLKVDWNLEFGDMSKGVRTGHRVRILELILRIMYAGKEAQIQQ